MEKKKADSLSIHLIAAVQVRRIFPTHKQWLIGKEKSSKNIAVNYSLAKICF